MKPSSDERWTQPSDHPYPGEAYGPDDPASDVGGTFDEEPQRGRGPRLTPLRVFLAIALIASLAVVGYGLVARDATQIPVLTAGWFICGIVFALLALAGAWAAFTRARDEEGGRALVYALFGGISALLSAGSFAAAIILTLALQK